MITEHHLDPTGDGAEFGLLLRDLHMLSVRQSQAWLADSGVSFAQMKILKSIANQPGASGAEIAIDAVSTPQAVAQVLSRLVDCGAVERSARKGRAIAHHLTEDGDRKLTAAIKAMAAMHDDTLDAVDPAARDLLFTAMRAMRERVIDREGRP